MPVTATMHTAAGAAAFAKFFVQTIDWGFATLNGSYIRHGAEAGCDSCKTLADGMDRDRRVGDRYIGGRLTITMTALRGRPVVTAAEATGLVNINVLSFEQIDKAGKPVTASPAHRNEQFEVSVRWRLNAWRVVRLGLNQ